MSRDDLFWRLLTANFLLLVGIACMVTVYVLGMGGPFAAVFLYVALFCIGWGVVRGLFVIIDHHRERKEAE